MLSKTKRLTVQDFKTGGRFVVYTTPYFDLKVKKAEITKYAVVVVSKRFKKAVERNKIRRRYYSAFECVQPKHAAHIIAYPKKETITISYEKLLEILQTLYNEHHL